MSRPVKPPSLLELQLQMTNALRRTAVRPSIAGYKPQDYQIPFHQSQAKGRLFIGGNRSGKTVGGAAEMVMHLTGKHQYWQKFKPPIRARAIGVDFDQGVKKIMMPEIARWIPPSLLINGSWEDSYSKGDRVLTLDNHSTLEFMSYDQDVDKFAGTSRHFIWFDEEPPEDIFNENMARLIDTGGNWWMSMTPLIEMSWTFDRLYEAGRTGADPNIDVFEVSTDQNKYINMAEMDIFTSGMTEEEKAARRKGTYISQSGTIYGKVLTPNVFIDPIIGFDEDKNYDKWPIFFDKWGHFGMLDHGFRNPTAFYLGAYDENGRVVIYYEYYETNRLVKENALAILSLIRRLGLSERLTYVVADPSIRNTDPIAGGSILQEYGEHGLYLALANNDVDAGINRVMSRFKNGQLYITKNCTKLIWELHRYRWDKFASSKIAGRRNLKETPVKKDDHACDAIRYGIVSRPELPGESPLRTGNIINAPVAITDDFTDTELSRMLGNLPAQEYYDYTLGSEY